MAFGRTPKRECLVRDVFTVAAALLLTAGACGISKPRSAPPGQGADASVDTGPPVGLHDGSPVGLDDGGLDGDAAVTSCPGSDQSCWASTLTPAPYSCRDRHCVDSDGGTRAVGVTFSSCGIDVSATQTNARPTDLPGWAGAIQADDDSCEFHVRVLPQCTANPRELSLAVELSSLTDGTLVTGANPYVIVFAGFTHLAPNSGTSMTETSPGIYEIRPIVFDIPGPWTITVHFFGSCAETRGSPHTHLSLTLAVP